MSAPGVNRLYLFGALLGPGLLGMSTSAFTVALPAVANGLGTDISGIAWSLVSFPIAVASFSVLFGRLGNSFGHRSAAVFGLSVMNAGALLCALSRNETHMAYARFFEGIGGAMIAANCRVLAVDAMPKDSVARAQGYVSLAVNLGAFFGYIIGGWIVDHYDWRPLFIFLCGLGLVFTAIDWKIMSRMGSEPQEPSPGLSKIDWSGTLLLLALISLATVLLHGRVAYKVTTHQRHMLAGVWFACFALFIAREYWAAHPMLKLSLFKVRNFNWSLLCILSQAMIMGIVSLFMPFYLYQIQRVDFDYIGLVYSIQPLFIVLCSKSSSKLADQYGYVFPVLVGLCVILIAVSIGITLKSTSPVILSALMLGMFGIGLGLLHTSIFARALDSVGRENRGQANGLIPTATQTGQILGAAISTTLLLMDFKFILGDHVIPPPEGGAAEAAVWEILRRRIYTDTFVVSFNASCLLAFVLCLVAIIAVYAGSKDSPSSSTAA